MNKPKAKGTAFERRLVDYLNTHGFELAERRALSGTNDRGDIAGTPGIVWEAKSHKALALAEWVDEMVTEKRNARATIGVVVHPRRNHSMDRAYVVMELSQFVEMIRD